MNADEMNQAQDDALSKLRAKIQQRKQEVENDLSIPFPSKKREYLVLPNLTVEANDEFSLDRYTELTIRVDYAHNNFMLFMVELRENLTNQEVQENFETALKVLCQEVTELLSEGMKPRF